MAGEADAAAHGDAVHHRHERLFVAGDAGVQPVLVAPEGLGEAGARRCRRGARRSPPAHRPRSPSPVSSTAAMPGSAANWSRAASIAPDHAVGQGVQRLRPVEADAPERADALDDHVGHQRPPSQRAGDDHPHDLVGAFQDLVDAQVADDLLDAVLGEVAVAAVELQRLVGDLEGGVGDVALGHGAELASRPAPWRRARRPRGAGRCAATSSSVAMSASRNCSAWKSESFGPKARRSRHVGEGLVERRLRAAERAGGDVEAPAVEARPWRSGSPRPRRRGGWPTGHAAAVEAHGAGRLGVPAHLALVGAEGEAGRALLDHDRRDALRPRRSPVRAMTR